MRFAICNLLMLGVLAVGAAGCDDAQSSTAHGSPAAPPRVLSQPTFGTGTIQGAVKFIGTPPPRAELANKPCHEGAEPLLDETVVVNADGTLANVFVYLKNAPASDGSAREPAVLDQVNCQYVPHAVAVQVGQTLRVRSSDPTLHNVHYDPSANPSANFGMTTAGSEKPLTFSAPEFVRFKCDVHPWMSAYVGVFESPFFAVTGEKSGSFAIPKVPAGQYTLAAWHERLGEVEQTVDVKDDGVVDVTVKFEEP